MNRFCSGALPRKCSRATPKEAAQQSNSLWFVGIMNVLSGWSRGQKQQGTLHQHGTAQNSAVNLRSTLPDPQVQGHVVETAMETAHLHPSTEPLREAVVDGSLGEFGSGWPAGRT